MAYAVQSLDPAPPPPPLHIYNLKYARTAMAQNNVCPNYVTGKVIEVIIIFLNFIGAQGIW